MSEPGGMQFTAPGYQRVVAHTHTPACAGHHPAGEPCPSAPHASTASEWASAYAELRESLGAQVAENAELSRKLSTTQAIARAMQALAIEIIDEVTGWSRDPLDTDELIARWRRTAGLDGAR